MLSRGQDGCWVDSGGKRHPVKWDDFLGHKVKVHPAAAVVDQGEDGLLVESPSGHRRFVRDELGVISQPDPPGVRPMAKSIGPMVLFLAEPDALLKAGTVKNRPGLSLQSVTDKAGHMEKRWKRTAQDAPAPKRTPHQERMADRKSAAVALKHGDRVKFKAGAFHGEGTVSGSPGHKGAHIQDETGRLHQVEHREIEPAGAGGGSGKGAGGGSGSGSGGDDGGSGVPPAPDWAPRAEGEEDKAFAKRVIDKGPSPAHLPDDPELYFHLDGEPVIPLDKLISTKSDEENKQGGDNGPKRMWAAAHGLLDKRMPIEVTPNADGTYTVVDGNGTLTSAKSLGFKGLPVCIVQPNSSKEEVIKGAAEGTEYLWNWLDRGKGFCDENGFKTEHRPPENVTPDEWRQPGRLLFVAPPKKESSAASKVNKEYGGNWGRLLDGARCTLSVDSMAEVQEMADKLRQAGMVVARMKDRFKKPTKAGYRDMMLNIRLPSGTVAELQLQLKPMSAVKEESHPHYEVAREISRDYADLESEQWPEDVRQKFEAAMAAMREIHGRAWDEANRSGASGAPADDKA